MEQYISKAALMAEIENIEADAICQYQSDKSRYAEGSLDVIHRIKHLLDTLEVKEVDFEREFDNYIEDQNAFINNDNSEIKYYNGDSFNHTYDIYPLAKHFFELGLKAQKGE